MDMSAGRDSTRRRRAATDEEDGGRSDGAAREGMEDQVVPLELYDPARAKIDANLRWLFGKAFGTDHIPTDLRNPFYTDQYDQEHIKPPIIRLLLSAELYCRVGGLILPTEKAASLQSHQSVIQALSNKGIHVLETNDAPVCHLDLSSSPIKMSSHIHLIDALMLAYMIEMVSIDKVVSSVKRFTNFSASKELPNDLEDAMVLWINKVNLKMRELTEKECKMKQHLLESPCHQKPDLLHALAHCMLEPVEFSRVVRYRRDHLSGRTLQHFPVLEDLSKDVCDGTALLTLVHFYCPEIINLEDICLKEVPSIADSVFNIQLLREFSDEYLNKCFYFKPEDLLYSPPALKINLMIFIAELFWWFEIVKPDFVQPRDLQEVKDVRLLLQPKSCRSSAPVSNVAKSRLLPSSNSADMISTTSHNPSIKQTSLSPSHSLPHVRRRQQEITELRNQPNSVTQADGQHWDSILAWPEQRARPLSQPVSLTTDVRGLAHSISKDSLASNIMTLSSNHVPPVRLPPHRLGAQNLLCHVRIEDEEEEVMEEELVSVIHPSAFSRRRLGSDMEQDDLEPESQTSPSLVSGTFVRNTAPFMLDRQHDGYYLEPLMPTVPKPAKEKSASLSKQEECGERPCRSASAAKKVTSNATGSLQGRSFVTESQRTISTPAAFVESTLISHTSQRSSTGTSQLDKKGFFLHLFEGRDTSSLSLPAGGSRHDSDSDVAELEEEEDDEDAVEKEMDSLGIDKFFRGGHPSEFGDGEGESVKLREDLKVSEREDKEDRCSSPCPSTVSCASSGSGSIRMTSFAEKKLLKLGLRDGCSSTSSSQKTTPDGSETAPAWQGKEPSGAVGKALKVNIHAVPPELLQLHMQLEEQRRAIEYQKKKMEALSARQRLKLGKAAFLNIVKKGGGRSDTLSLPLKHSQGSSGIGVADRVAKTQSCKDDSCLDALKGQAEEGASMSKDKMQSSQSPENSTEPDVNECSRSIDLLNEAISSIQRQMMQLTLQQDLLMKQSVVSPQEPVHTDTSRTLNQDPPTSDSKSFAVHFVDIGGGGSVPARRAPQFSSSKRKKTSELKDSKENSRVPPVNTSKCFDRESIEDMSEIKRSERNIQRNVTFRVHGGFEERSGQTSGKPKSQDPPVISQISESLVLNPEPERVKVPNSDQLVSAEISFRTTKAPLIEVDLSELKDPREDAGDSSAEAEQRSGLGFFFKNEEKAEDEMAKRRAAFLLKQQRKAEEARLRKQQQEVETELKRDEARRKAEDERIRKEEEKARRELIKQEYLRRKQEALMEEQGLVKPHARMKTRRNRPKSLHREESSSFSKGSTTPDGSFCHRGSTLSLVAEADGVSTGEMEKNRAGSVCSMESFPLLSRTSSRNMERDWETGSVTSSITSIEYNGPKLFKEPSSKSNKPIIINAIAHCCLAGKVNEAQKNVVLEELEKCECNHLIILFRDSGCQFRAIYTYSPDTEEILKFTGTGPRNINRNMIDKLYKYSSDRKQFTVIPAKTVSASIDALTIHNHLWQINRPGSARRK